LIEEENENSLNGSGCSAISSRRFDSLDMSANMSFVCLFVFTVNVPGVLLGYAMAYQNQCSEWSNVKFHWQTESE